MAAAVLLAGFGLSGCANNQHASSAPPHPATITPVNPQAVSSETGNKKACTADDVMVQGSFGQRPKVTIPRNCQPPKQLLIKDLKVGAGPAVRSGDTATVNYQLVAWSTGNVVDSSFKSGQPFPVRNVGHAQVIQGWNTGLIGAKQGGRRLLVVPPKEGYGSQAKGPLKPNETLVFVIDIVKVTHG